MRVVDLLKKKIRQISILVTSEDLKGVLALSVQDSPEGARYKVGDTIHTAGSESTYGDLKVYGIKEGGYGFAYIVLDEETLTPYCLKTLRDKFVDSSRLDQFKREAEIWIRLGKHPNLVYAHSVLNIGGLPYILFEYVAGSDLWSRIKTRPLPVRLALKYAIQFCRGMVYAQNTLPGFVHGDIKPNNCLLSRDDILKIADLGQANLQAIPLGRSKPPRTDKPPHAGIEVFDTPLNSWRTGTPPYMAPEQFDPVNKLDTRSDVYAFGVMLFEMLTGTRPFAGMDHEECFAQHKNAIPPDPVSLNAEIPLPLAKLILNCLAKSPPERPADFSVLEKELSSLLWTIDREEVASALPDELTDEELINRGISLTVLEHYDEALACFDSVLSVKPQVANAWSHKGDVLSRLHRFDEALVCFNRALDLDPQLVIAWSSKGEALNTLGRYDEALACFDQALALNSQLAFVWNNKGHTFTSLGQARESLTCFQQARSLDPLHFEIHNNLGIAYHKLGRNEEAIEAYKQAIKLNPLFAEAHHNLGNTYSRSGCTKEAIESYRQALSLKPDYLEARHELGNAYRAFYSSGKQTLSETCAEEMISFLLAEQHDPQVTVSSLVDFVRISDFDPRVFYLCAAKLCDAFKRFDRQQAETLIHTLARVREDITLERDQSALYWLGKIYYGLDLYDSCMEVFQQSIKLFGPDDKALYYLGACNEISGNHKIALNYYKEALLFDPGCSLTLDGIERMEAEVAFRSAS